MSTHVELELQVLQDSRHSASNTKASFESRTPTINTADAHSDNHAEARATQAATRGRSIAIILQLAGVEFLSSFNNGTLTVGLPTIAEALSIHEDLYIWSSSVFYLTCGTLLLIAGSVADVIGPRKVALTGCALLATFVLACAFVQTAIQLIMFRAMAGVAYAMISPSSVSLISASIEAGTRRNIGFSCIGVSKILGFSSGLVLGGVFVASSGWRTGYYLGGALGYAFLLLGIWVLPKIDTHATTSSMLHRLWLEIDWLGALLASTGLATLSVVLAMLSANVQNIRQASTISILILSLISFTAFVAWMQWQAMHGRPALVPNSLWRKASFTTVCVMILLSNAICDSMELFSSLFFQEVQGISALGTSLRILPSLVVGAILNFTTGVFVNRVSTLWAVLISSGLCAIAPLLMALVQPGWPYWYDAFFAQILAPLSVDVLFTVGLLVVADSFPIKTQALAGAVFNTFSQLGVSVGLTTMSIISTAVTKNAANTTDQSSAALMAGYRASFWTMFSWMVTACLIGAVGLRNVGEVGMKRE